MAHRFRPRVSLIPTTPPGEPPLSTAVGVNDDTWPDAGDGSDEDDEMFQADWQVDGSVAITIEEEDEEFVDAPETFENEAEVVAREKTGAISLAGDSTDDDAEGEDDPMYDLGRAVERRDTLSSVQEDAHDTDGEDLFASTFGRKVVKAEDDDVEEAVHVQKDAGKDKYQQAFLDAISKHSQHSKDRNGSRGASTPPASLPSSQSIKKEPSTTPTAPAPAVFIGPDPIRDRSKQLVRYERFYTKAKQLIPRLPLGPHRYWIGVLNFDKQPKTVNKEKDFTWMKGSRLTTIETVWHAYETCTCTSGFALMQGQQRVEFKCRAEELDLFNDKIVILRAVMDGMPEAEHREVFEGIVPPDIVEIDDD